MVFGLFVFQALENRPNEELTARNLAQSLARDLMQNYNATKQEAEGIIGRARAIVHQQNEAEEADWTFYSSLYFVGSVITTIGEFKLKLNTLAADRVGYNLTHKRIQDILAIVFKSLSNYTIEYLRSLFTLGVNKINLGE